LARDFADRKGGWLQPVEEFVSDGKQKYYFLLKYMTPLNFYSNFDKLYSVSNQLVM
jgi:hypothetical protein